MAQQLQNVTISAPAFFGINTQDSPVDLNPSFASIADNCVIDTYGRIGARKGFDLLTTNGATVLGTSRGIETIFEYIDQSGDIKILSAGNNKIFSGTTTLTDITPSGYTPTANNWKFVNLANHAYGFQRGHESIIYTDESGSGVLSTFSGHAHSSGTAPQANEVLAAYGRLWAADVSGNKHTIFFSHLGVGHQWTGGSSGSLDITTVLPNGSDDIVALAAHNGKLVIFCKNTIIIYTGATNPATMVLEDTIIGIGCIERDTLVNTGTDLLFLSSSGVRSLSRTVQEKSAAIGDISKNVRNDLLTLIPIQNQAIKAVYSPEESFYLLVLPTSEIVYAFDTRIPLDNGAYRVTTWSSITPLSFARLSTNKLYIGKTLGIGEYKGYLDNDASYQLRYFSNPLAFDSASNVKFLKKFKLTIIGGSGTQMTLNWGYDYSESYTKQALSFSGTVGDAEVAEYGVSEYNTVAEYTASLFVNTPSVNGTGSGSVVSVGLEAQIKDVSFSIQKIDIQVLLGRLI
jgi:hypothetical protein